MQKKWEWESLHGNGNQKLLCTSGFFIPIPSHFRVVFHIPIPVPHANHFHPHSHEFF